MPRDSITQPNPPRVAPIVFALGALIVAGALLAFWPALGAGFTNWDDDRNFVTNPNYRGLSSDNFHWAWNTYHVGVWQPAAWALLGVEHLVAGVDESGVPRPGVYHAFSLAFHTADALALFALIVVVLRVSFRDAPARDDRLIVFAAGAVALLFAVHPLRTEPAVWISSQPYLPSIFFAMLGAIVYLRGQAKRDDGSTARGALALTPVLYCVAVLLKAVAITLPAVLLIADVYPLKRLSRRNEPIGGRVMRLLLEKAPFLIVAWRIAHHASASKEVWQPGADLVGLGLGDRILQSCYGLVFYLAKTIVPTGLSPFYELPASIRILDPRFGGAVVFIVVGVVAMLGLRRRMAPIAAAFAAYFVIALPNLGIVQISQQLGADRYSYMASIPLAALVAAGFYRLLTGGPASLRRMRVIGLSLAVIVASLSLIRMSRAYAATWRDSKTLWSHALRIDPKSPHAHCGLGVALLSEGDYANGADHLQRAIGLKPDFAFAYSNLGIAM
ncbi:MAG: hypothetical protein KDA33_12420, partial [Phycisphaerales bacterium]|nr:hypothetical protein [Phycisphaerales bacterium]